MKLGNVSTQQNDCIHDSEQSDFAAQLIVRRRAGTLAADSRIAFARLLTHVGERRGERRVTAFTRAASLLAVDTVITPFEISAFYDIILLSLRYLLH